MSRKKSQKSSSYRLHFLLTALLLSTATLLFFIRHTYFSSNTLQKTLSLPSNISTTQASISGYQRLELPYDKTWDKNRSRFIKLNFSSADSILSLQAGWDHGETKSNNSTTPTLQNVLWQTQITGQSLITYIALGRYYDSRYLIALSTNNNFFLFHCTTDFESELFISCSPPKELPQFKNAQTFDISQDGKSVLIIPTNSDGSMISVLSTSDYSVTNLSNPYNSNTKFKIQSGSLYALAGDNSFAYWYKDTDANRDSMVIYKNKRFSQIINVPNLVTFKNGNQSAIDRLNTISMTSNNELCFSWGSSGTQGIFIQKNGTFVQGKLNQTVCSDE